MGIREALDLEFDAVLRVERLAFGRDDEPNLVAELLRDETAQPLLSLVAEGVHPGVPAGRRRGPSLPPAAPEPDDAVRLLGHVLFTAVELVGASPPVACSILAPLAVLPEVQGTGIGARLIEAGCERLAARGVALVFVLGDPDYYGRFGFEAAIPLGLEAPYAIEPVAAWRVRALRAGVVGEVRGRVRCARAVEAEHLWRE